MNYDPLAEITMPDLTEALAKPEEVEPEWHLLILKKLKIKR